MTASARRHGVSLRLEAKGVTHASLIVLMATGWMHGAFAA